MKDSKTIIFAVIALIAGFVVYAVLSSSHEPIMVESKPPPLKVQAVQIKETVMADTLALQGVLQRGRNFFAVLKGGAECAGKIKAGLEAMVRVENLGIAYKSAVSQIIAAGGGYTVKIPLPQAAANLSAGTAVTATIYGTTNSSALTVPWAAVDRRNGSCLWVVRSDGTAKRIDIKLGSYDDNMVAVSGAVKNDEWVVLSPHDQLNEDRELEVSEIY